MTTLFFGVLYYCRYPGGRTLKIKAESPSKTKAQVILRLRNQFPRDESRQYAAPVKPKTNSVLGWSAGVNAKLPGAGRRLANSGAVPDWPLAMQSLCVYRGYVILM